MPMYEYRCPSCKTQFEVVKSMDHASDTETCSCGTIAQRVYTPLHFNLWCVDWRENDGEKEAIDAGMYE